MFFPLSNVYNWYNCTLEGKLKSVNYASFQPPPVELADGKQVHYLDIGDKFLAKDKTLSREIMPDLLHLSPQGYEIWAASIESMVAKLLGE